MTIAQAMQQAVAFQNAGQFAEAEQIYRAVLGQMPDNAYAMNFLGLALVARGQRTEGLELLRKSVQAHPPLAQFASNLAGALLSAGDAPAAESAAREAIGRDANDAAGRIHLAQALWAQGRQEQGLAEAQKAAELQPMHAPAHSQLGLFLLESGRAQESAAALSRALQLAPIPANHANLGNAMAAVENHDAAIDLNRRAIALDPQRAEYSYNLALSLASVGRPLEAINSLRRAIQLRPEFFEARLMLAKQLKDTLQADEALVAYRDVLALWPDHAPALHGLGMVLASLGLVREGMQSIRRAIEVKPDDFDAHDALVFLSNFHPDYDAQAVLREHLGWNRKFVRPLAARIPPHLDDRDADRRLRIGYVSPDFREHVLAFYHVPLLSHHDHANFEIFCYSDVKNPDEVTQRVGGYADSWRQTSSLSDDQLADQIRADRIDILVDLTMHMANGRPLLFARKPAPVQVQWCYPGTTGNQAIDYRLTDPWCDPPGQFDADYSEKSIRLPDSFFIYDPLSEQPPVNKLPALTAGYITFGCLNNFMKVNESTLDLWAKVLSAVPNSRLILLTPSASARQRVADHLRHAGVDAARLDFVSRQPRPQYLATYHRIDISLDTLPYNGHTTSMDSCWMGVPVVTLIGKTVVGRAGWSLCCNLDLRELAAQTPQQFVEIANKLADDLPALSALRENLRPRMAASPLMDGAKFAKAVEAVYRQIWRE
jgi:protein O-GlcNAc transferase